MKIKAHMIVTSTICSGKFKHPEILIEQAEKWLNNLRELPDNLDKIGNFIYYGSEEPTGEEIDGVRFFLEVNNEE